MSSTASTESLPNYQKQSWPTTPSRATYILFQRLEENSLTEAELEELIKNGADVNAFDSYGESPLHICAKKGNIIAAGILLCYGADLNTRSVLSYNSPLRLAIDNRQCNFAQWLINEHANVNAADLNNESPLHVVTRSGDLHMAQILIQAGGDPFLPNIFAETPFTICLSRLGNSRLEQCSSLQTYSKMYELFTEKIFIEKTCLIPNF